MKKTDFVLIGLVLVIILVGVLSTRGMKEEKEIQYPLTLAGKVGSNEITYDEYEEMVKNDDAFIVIIERTGCSYCQMYMPLMEEVAKEAKVYKVNVDENEDLALEYRISSIPCVIVFKDGKEIERSIGLKTKEEILKMVK